jgi:hypothetical protein
MKRRYVTHNRTTNNIEVQLAVVVKRFDLAVINEAPSF